MSNRLAKVLMVCSLIVLVPILVVGTVLAVYFSKNESVNVEIYTNVQSGEVTTPAISSDNAYVSYDEENSYYVVTNGHNLNTNMTANLSSGLTFKGWYIGTSTEYQTALTNGSTVDLTEEATISVKTGDGLNYTAVYDVVTFTVSYNYDADPTDSDTTTTTEAPDSHASTYEYGEVLPTLTLDDNVDDNDASIVWQFTGWQISGSSDTTVYTKANFSESTTEVTLVAVWENSASIARTISITSTDADYLVSSFDFVVSTGSSDIEALFNEEYWDITSSYANIWELKSISYNNIAYTDASALLSAISATFDTEITLVGNFGCIYDSVLVNGVKYATSDDGEVYNENGYSSGMDYSDDWESYVFSIYSSSDIYDADSDNWSVFSLFYNNVSAHQYYTDENAQNAVTMQYFQFGYYTYSGSSYSLVTTVTFSISDFEEDSSIYNLISKAVEKIEGSNGTVDYDTSTFSIGHVQLYFA